MSRTFWELTEVIDAAAAAALLEPFRERWLAAEARGDVDGVVDIECWTSGRERRHHAGAPTLDALELPSEGASLFISGDLTVSGSIIQPFRAGFLVVLGNLRARSIVTTAQIVVTGDLVVEDTIYGNCTNYSTSVLGKTTARVLVSAKEHYYCLYGGREIGTIVDVYGDTPNLDDRHRTGPEALAMQDAFDAREAATILGMGGSLLAQPRA